MNGSDSSQGLGTVHAGDITALARLFQEFQASTDALQQAYDRLQKRVAEIDAELEVKNAELEQANQALQRKMAELDDVRQYLANVLESMNSGVVTIGTDGRITMVNPTASCWFQGESSTLQGRPITDFFPIHFVPCVLNALSSGERFSDVEESLIALDGSERFIRTSAAPLFDATGNRIGALMIFNDITQLRLLQEKARRQDRLAALGELAAGVAHEMRNPLTTIRGYIQILPT
ncbi:MAG TPA: PAS domain-containing protein, partial [bacterium]|nr:PAS domain-containing protein [bacterium]